MTDSPFVAYLREITTYLDKTFEQPTEDQHYKLDTDFKEFIESKIIKDFSVGHVDAWITAEVFAKRVGLIRKVGFRVN